jgi:hypothetical protein
LIWGNSIAGAIDLISAKAALSNRAAGGHFWRSQCALLRFTDLTFIGKAYKTYHCLLHLSDGYAVFTSFQTVALQDKQSTA